MPTVAARDRNAAVDAHRSQNHKRWTASQALLTIFPAVAAAGVFASTDPRYGSPFYLFRLVVLLAGVPICLHFLTRRARPIRDHAVTAYLVLGGVWLLWAPATLIWSPAFEKGVDEIVSVSFGLIAGLTIVATAREANSLRLGWTFAFVVTSAVSVWEFRTGQHLGSALTSEAVFSTFGNPNDYAAFLLACLPFLVWGALDGRTVRSRWAFTALLPLWALVVLATQSRTGLFGGAILAIASLAWAASRKRQRLIGPLMIATFIGLAFLVTPLWQQVSEQLQYDYSTSGRSNNIRLNLTRTGLGYVFETGGRGLGAGAFESSLMSERGGYGTGSIVNAHNSFIEVAAQYGLLLALPLLAVLAAIVSPRRISPKRRRSDDPARVAQLLGLAAFIVAGLTGSSVLTSPWWWCLLGTLIAQASLLTASHSPESETR